jgi:hypothetical protein
MRATNQYHGRSGHLCATAEMEVNLKSAICNLQFDALIVNRQSKIENIFFERGLDENQKIF